MNFNNENKYSKQNINRDKDKDKDNYSAGIGSVIMNTIDENNNSIGHNYDNNDNDNDNECINSCDKFSESQIIDLIDNDLVDENNYLALLDHIDTCKSCSMLFNQLKTTNKILGKLQNNKNNFIDGIPETYKSEKINDIKKLLRNEIISELAKPAININIIEKSKKVSSLAEYFNKFRNNINYKQRFIRISSTAAALVVIVFALYMFSQMGINKNININETRTAQTNYGDMASTQGKISENQTEMDGVKSPEISQAGAQTAIDANKSATASSDLSQILVAPTRSIEIYNIIMSSSYYLQLINNETKYLNIMCFPKNIIDEKAKLFQSIEEKYNAGLKIEIISRENSQKLLEYTSNQMLTVFEEKALEFDADFLIISIGR